jgi:hypothetical protein
VSAVAALMAAMMVVMSAPAMADDNDNDFNRFGIFGNDNDLNDNDVIDFLINDLNDNDLNDNNLFDLNDLDNNGFDNALEQESESGDLETNFSVENTGDYAFQCTPALQFGNTGNFNNGSTFVQGFGSELDDFEPGGIEFAFEPEQSTDCSNTIQQSSAASSW